MYIKILLTIITVCQLYGAFRGLYLDRIITRIATEVMPKVVAGINQFFPGVSDENIKPFQN